MIAILALPLALLGLQQSIADRLAGRVSPAIAALVHELGTAAAARGLPVDPLIQKAIEGSAKGIPAERVAAAVRMVAVQLDSAAAGLRDAGAGGGLASDNDAIAAGAFAITAGLKSRDIAQIARGAARPSDVAVGLRVAGTLTALGVPPAETVTLVAATLQAGGPTGDLLALPGRLQSAMAKGAGPAQAATGLARAAAAQARRGPPPGQVKPHPQPPPKP
jgi:hypothetical protein